jgi:hypothetical protein
MARAAERRPDAIERCLERDVPGLMRRVPAARPYSLDQILSPGEEDWFPQPALLQK